MRKKIFLTRYTAEKLPRKVLYMVTWKGSEVVLLEEIIHTHAKQLRDKTYVVAVVETRE